MSIVTDMGQAINMIAAAVDETHAAMEELDYWDKKTQDILHDIELAEHTEAELAALAAELREVRRARREAKDRYEELTPLCRLLESTTIAAQLARALGEMRKAEEKHKNRVYIRRTENKGELIVGGPHAD